MKALLVPLLLLAGCLTPAGDFDSPFVAQAAATGQLWVHTDGLRGVAYGEGSASINTWLKGVGLPTTVPLVVDAAKVWFWEGSELWSQEPGEPWPDWAGALFLDFEAYESFFNVEAPHARE